MEFSKKNCTLSVHKQDLHSRLKKEHTTGKRFDKKNRKKERKSYKQKETEDTENRYGLFVSAQKHRKIAAFQGTKPDLHGSIKRKQRFEERERKPYKRKWELVSSRDKERQHIENRCMWMAVWVICPKKTRTMRHSQVRTCEEIRQKHSS